MHESRIGLTAAALCGLLLCLPAFAQTPAGSVIFAAGDVRIVDAAGRQRRAVKGASVSVGETLVSGARASAQLRMKDGGFIALRPESRLRIDAYVFNGREDGNERSLLSLLKGGFRTITGLIGLTRKDRYQVRTPTATIGIRGTDHEPLYIAPPAPGERPIGPPGTYDKVNVGIAYIETPTGTVDVLPNQVGFAAPGAVPRVLPRIPEFFRATGEPSEARERVAAAVEQAATLRERIESDLSSAAKEIPPAPPPPASVPEPIVALIGTSDTSGLVDLTSQTITDPNGNTVPIDLTGTSVRLPGTLAAVISYGPEVGTAAADDFSPLPPEVIRDAATNALIGVGESYLGLAYRDRLISPTPIAPSVSTTAAGIEYGRWSGGTLEQSWAAPIGASPAPGEGFVNLPRWGYAPEGYLEPTYLPGGATPLTGTFNYVYDSSTTPIDQVTGQGATLNAANTTFLVDFGASTWDANVELTLGADTWTATATNQTLAGNTGSASADPGGQFNNLTVTKGTCSTCLVGGSLDWGFTGQNYRGLLLLYNVYEQNPSGGQDLADIGGTVAFTRNDVSNPVITDGTPAPTGNVWVVDTNSGLVLVPTGQVFTGSGGLLTGYNLDAGGGYYLHTTTSAGTTGTVINANDPLTGIVLGTWDSGATSYVYGQPLGTGQFHWALGPEVSPLYLPQVLTGSLTYTLDAWTPPTNQAGSAGSVSSANLTANFTSQTVGLDLSLAGVGGHDWTASAPDMRLDGRRFDSHSAVTPMTVTMDPLTTPVTGSGEFAGSLTGAGVNGAAVSYAFSALPAAAPMESVNGVLAFSATAQDTAAPYRIVGATGSNLGAGTDPSSYVNGEFNAGTRVTFDAATPPNISAFDSSVSGTSGSLAVTLTPGTLTTLTDAGTDPTTGISWGRWSGDVVVVTDRATGALLSRVPNPGSLHWIAGPEMTGPVALPTSGVFAYTKVGNTSPTDSLGNVGTLNSATFSANFTAMTVDAHVNATVAGTTLDGLAQGMAIMPRGHFGTETGTMTVNCTGTCGTASAGAMGGAFTGPTGNGAALLYHMNTTGGLPAPVEISGAAAFSR